MFVKSYLSKQIEEIKQSNSLIIYGFFLALTNVVTAFHWIFGEISANNIFQSKDAICYPFFMSCSSIRPFITEHLELILFSFLFTSVLSVIVLIKERKGLYQYSYYFLLFSFLCKIILYFQDYRLSGNFHYMINIIFLLYLFVPRKIDTIKIFICLFYFFAGILKINSGWFSGDALIREPLVDGIILKFLLIYSFVLELIGPWLLLRKNRMRSFIVCNFLLFHLFSWHIVGYFYPVIMFLLISIFVIDESDVRAPCRTSTLLILIFSTFQLIPKVISTDASISGEGRMFSLSMLDDYVQCRDSVHYEGDFGPIPLDHDLKRWGVRLACDPLSYWSLLKYRCQIGKKARINVFLESKKKREGVFKEVLVIRDFCSQDIEYSMFQRNKWIHK